MLLQDDGTVITVKAYLRQHFNFRYDMLGVAVAVLVAYIAIYGCVVWRSPHSTCHVPHQLPLAGYCESNVVLN